MCVDNPKLHRFLHITLATLAILLVIAIAVHIALSLLINTEQPADQEQAELPLVQIQEPTEVVFEGETEYGYEVCYDNDVCVVNDTVLLEEAPQEEPQ